MKKILLLMAVALPFVFISCGDDKDEPVATDGHKYVDLGLHSGTLWATCNIGANNPEEYGDYFAWGETAPKNVYTWENYKWCNGSFKTMTKYCTDSYYGTVDSIMELERADDAAYVNWGSSWRMPTLEQLIELVTECNWTWTQQNGVNGHLVTGPNGASLFLPAAGDRWEESSYGTGSQGHYWSRALTRYSTNASLLFFTSYGMNWDTNDRSCGFSVRAVRVSQN